MLLMFLNIGKFSLSYLPGPDFTIIADKLAKSRPKSFEDIAYLPIRCLIYMETRTSTQSAGDNGR